MEHESDNSGICATSPGSRRYELRLAATCLLWAVLFTSASWLIRGGRLPSGPVPWMIAILPTLAAGYVVWIFVRFLRESDELQRLIQLQAMAMGFGAGFFAISGYHLLEQLGAPAAGVELTVVMPVVYAVGTLIGNQRYR